MEEPAFDSRVLRTLLLERIRARTGIDLLNGVEALLGRVRGFPAGSRSRPPDGALEAKRVISAAYSGLNSSTRHRGCRSSAYSTNSPGSRWFRRPGRAEELRR